MNESYGNGYVPIIAQAIEEMKAEQGASFSLEQINLAELELCVDRQHEERCPPP